MKRVALLLAGLAACTTDTTPPVPHLSFQAGERFVGPAEQPTRVESLYLGNGDQLVPGVAVTVTATWRGTCDAGTDPTNDKPNPCEVPEENFRLDLGCTGGACTVSAPQHFAGAGGGKIADLTVGGLGVDATMTSDDSGEASVSHLDLAVVPATGLVARCKNGNGILTARAVVGDTAFEPTGLLVNGRPLTVGNDDLVFDLAALYPTAADEHGDVADGAYSIALQLGDIVVRKIVDITTLPSLATECSVRDGI